MLGLKDRGDIVVMLTTSNCNAPVMEVYIGLNPVHLIVLASKLRDCIMAPTTLGHDPF